jgi:nucleoside-diphosphate-sugar epimerase
MSHPLGQDLDYILEHTTDVWKELRGASIFITGGTGFVGTWLLESLVWADRIFSLGVKATVITRAPEVFARKAPHLASHCSLRLVEADVAYFPFLPAEFPFVIHAATERHFEGSAEEPLSTFARDVEGTRRVLEFCWAHGARRVLFTSSGAIYGKQPPHLTHIPEDYAGAPSPMDTKSACGQGKRVSEWMCAMYAAQYGFDALIARLFSFVGPHLPLDANSAAGNFVRDVIEGDPIRVPGDGMAEHSYLYAADLAIWLWTILVKGKSCRPYNVGSGEEISMANLARTVAANTRPGTEIEMDYAAAPGPPTARYVPSVDRAWRELGLRPRIGLAEGVRRMHRWNVAPVLEPMVV